MGNGDLSRLRKFLKKTVYEPGLKTDALGGDLSFKEKQVVKTMQDRKAPATQELHPEIVREDQRIKNKHQQRRQFDNAVDFSIKKNLYKDRELAKQKIRELFIKARGTNEKEKQAAIDKLVNSFKVSRDIFITQGAPEIIKKEGKTMKEHQQKKQFDIAVRSLVKKGAYEEEGAKELVSFLFDQAKNSNESDREIAISRLGTLGVNRDIFMS